MGCIFSEDKSYIYFQIIGIEKSNYCGDVYNFHVETSTYLCKHITTHNCDPADHDYVSVGASDMSMYLLTRQQGMNPPRMVFSYTDRPQKSSVYYEQALMALIYYNKTQALIENNRYGMISYFENNGYLSLLKPEPVPKNTLVRKESYRIGIRKTVASTKEMERCINEYTNDYCHLIPEIELLDDFMVYGTKNTDRTIAFGWALVSLEEEGVTEDAKKKMADSLPKWKYVRRNGQIIRQLRQ